MNPVWIVAFWCGGLAVSAVAGGLEFERARVEFRVDPGQERVSARFVCRNGGDQPARIEAVNTDCSCLDAQAPDAEIPPGGQAEVSAGFRVGSMRGTVEKHLWVKVREGEKVRRILLSAVLVVPEMVAVEPRTLSWEVGGSLREQSFRLRVAGDEPIRLLGVKCARDEFEFRVETIDPGREYLVHVRPKVADHPSIALVNFETDCRHEKFRSAMGFVHVRRPQ